MTNVLVVTSSVGVVHGVHDDSSNSGPHLSLGLISMMLSSGLQNGLIGSLSSSDQSNGGSARSWDGLSGSRWQSNSGLKSIFGVSNNSNGGSGASSVGSSVSDLSLDVVANGTFGDLIDGEHISDGDGGLLSAVDVLTNVGSFSGQEVLSIGLEFIWVSEGDFG